MRLEGFAFLLLAAMPVGATQVPTEPAPTGRLPTIDFR